jgi:Tfp pilus assembly protein PilO
MNEQLRKQMSTYRRTLENRKIQSLIYSSLLLITIIVFDFAGVYSLYRISMQKYQTLTKLRKLVADLNQKSENTHLLKQKLDESKFYLDELEKAIPKTQRVEDYTAELVKVAASKGFKHRKMNIQHIEKEFVLLRAYFQGPSSQVGPLISAIESMERLASVQSFRYNVSGETAEMSMYIKIYYLER